MSVTMDFETLDRMVKAVEKVRLRLIRVVDILRRSEIDYAISGGNAVASWVSQIDEAAVRNTQDVDVMIRRSDLTRLTHVMESEGFIYRHVRGLDMFLDGESASVRDAVYLIFAGEFVRQGEPLPNPEMGHWKEVGGYRVLDLEALVQIKLTANRDKDRTHLRDMIDVGLIDNSWVGKFPEPLNGRLQHILNTPDG